MPAWLAFMLRWRGWTVALAMMLLGTIFIFGDRLAARHVNDRPWIIHPKSKAEQLALQTPWPKQIDEIILPAVKFRFTSRGSQLADIVGWIEENAKVNVEVNWRALARANVGRQSPMWFDSTNVALPALFDALAANVRCRTGTMAKLAWVAEPDRTIYLTTAQDLAEERYWREQRSKNATTELRKALERKVSYVDLYVTPINGALEDCARIGGVKIDLKFSPELLPETATRIWAKDVSFDQIIELILRRKPADRYSDERGDIPPLRFRADYTRLLVFRAGTEK